MSSSPEQTQRSLSTLNWEGKHAVVEEDGKVQPASRNRSTTMFEMSKLKNEEEDESLEIPPLSGFQSGQELPSSVDIIISPRTRQRARRTRKVSRRAMEKTSSPSDERITKVRREKLSMGGNVPQRKHGQGASPRGKGINKISRMRKVTSFRHATPRLSPKKKEMVRAKSFRACVEKKETKVASEDLLEVVQREFLTPRRHRYSVARFLCNQYYRTDPRKIAFVLAELYAKIDAPQVEISKKDFFYEVAFLVANRDLSPCVWYLSEKMGEEFVSELFRICSKNHTVLFAISPLTEFELSISTDSAILFRKDSLVSKLTRAYLHQILTKKRFFKTLKHKVLHELKKMRIREGKIDLSKKDEAEAFIAFATTILSHLYSTPLPKLCARLLRVRANIVKRYNPDFVLISLGEMLFLRVINPFLCSNPVFLADPRKQSIMIVFSKILQNISNGVVLGDEKKNPLLEQFNEPLMERFAVIHQDYLRAQVDRFS